MKHQLAQINTTDEEEIIPLLDGVSINICKYDIPKFNKATTLHTFETPPTLTNKQANTIIDIANMLKDNKDFYFLLSDVINLEYNMPMNILNILGENVLPLSALSVLEVIMTYATTNVLRTSYKPFIYYSIDS